MIDTASGALELVLAQPNDRPNDRWFICNRLETLMNDKRITVGAFNRAKMQFERLLGPSFTLDGWIRRTAPSLWYKYTFDSPKYNNAIMQARRAWAADMIKWHKARGD
jgi:hypothetical protein